MGELCTFCFEIRVVGVLLHLLIISISDYIPISIVFLTVLSECVCIVRPWHETIADSYELWNFVFPSEKTQLKFLRRCKQLIIQVNEWILVRFQSPFKCSKWGHHRGKIIRNLINEDRRKTLRTYYTADRWAQFNAFWLLIWGCKQFQPRDFSLELKVIVIFKSVMRWRTHLNTIQKFQKNHHQWRVMMVLWFRSRK